MHPVVEDLPIETQCERPDKRALEPGSGGGGGRGARASSMYFFLICLLRVHRMRPGFCGQPSLQRMQGPGYKLYPVHISTSGECHLDGNLGILSLVSILASRAEADFHWARGLLFQRHAVPTVSITPHASCLASRLRHDGLFASS